MSIKARFLPDVLSFPGTKQSSISVLRALKNIKEQLQLSITGVYYTPGQESALDDLDLLIGANANGRDLEVENI